jgi:hypothetical protein
MTTVVNVCTGGYNFIPSDCPYCKAPTLDQSPNYDNCENCGYWHCYSDGEGWVPENYKSEVA